MVEEHIQAQKVQTVECGGIWLLTGHVAVEEEYQEVMPRRRRKTRFISCCSDSGTCGVSGRPVQEAQTPCTGRRPTNAVDINNSFAILEDIIEEIKASLILAVDSSPSSPHTCGMEFHLTDAKRMLGSVNELSRQDTRFVLAQVLNKVLSTTSRQAIHFFSAGRMEFIS